MAIAHASFDSTIERLKRTVPSLDGERITRALRFAEKLYDDRPMELMDGVTCFDHACKVAEMLTEFCPDEDAIIACILQHALRIPGHQLDHISDEFGRGVRDMVSRIHLLAHLNTSDWRKSVDDMKIMLVSISDDVRILLIVLTIECYFMQHIRAVKPEFRVRLSRQSLQLFAPVAARLGIYTLKYRLERDAFQECYPTDAILITEQLSGIQEENGSFLDKTSTALKRFLIAEGIQADVFAREKQAYSIFQKMRLKSVTGLNKINDLFAIRLVVPTVADCYQTLGLIHRLATPISHRFKDYISFPKPNGYQSLHTCLLGLPNAPKNMMIEVQIRTPEMHREAEYGVAAHWLYKEQGKEDSVMRSATQLHLSDVLLKQHSVGAKPYTEADSPDTRLVNHIYVLTPRGDIIELPEGGTPLDFAFVVHTDLGLKFKSARVNGSIVGISHKLENGDIVEIQTHKHARPSLQWLEELATPSARSKLKTYFFSHNRSEFLLKGKASVNSELATRGLPQLDNDLSAISVFNGKALSVKEREDLLVKIGMGSVRTSSILRHLKFKAVPAKPNRGAGKTKTTARTVRTDKDLVRVEGQPHNLPYRFAKCCGLDAKSKEEEIIGIVTRNGVITVHKHGCKMGKSANSERRVRMRWM